MTKEVMTSETLHAIVAEAKRRERDERPTVGDRVTAEGRRDVQPCGDQRVQRGDRARVPRVGWRRRGARSRSCLRLPHWDAWMEPCGDRSQDESRHGGDGCLLVGRNVNAKGNQKLEDGREPANKNADERD